MTEVCNRKVWVVSESNGEWDYIMGREIRFGEVYTVVRSRKNIVIRDGVKEFIFEYFLLEVRRWVSMDVVMEMDEWRDNQIDKII
jgi:hypothetical protein